MQAIPPPMPPPAASGWAPPTKSAPSPAASTSTATVPCSACGVLGPSLHQNHAMQVICARCTTAGSLPHVAGASAPHPGLATTLSSAPPPPVASTSKPPILPKAQPLRDFRAVDEPPPGSCPGDGRCNGQGGQACCGGCPAFYNRYKGLLPSAASMVSRVGAGVEADGNTSTGSEGSSSGAISGVGIMQCENCETRTTPLWRRDGEGRVACNACGLYYKLHGQHRPVNLKKPTITRRKRMPAAQKDQTGRFDGPKRAKTYAAAPAKKSTRNAAATSGAPSESGESASSPPATALTPGGHSRSLPELAALASRMLSEEREDDGPLPTSMDELHAYRSVLVEDIRRGHHEAQRMQSRLIRAEQVLAQLDAVLGVPGPSSGPDTGSAANSPIIAQHSLSAGQQSPLDAFLEAIPIATALPIRRRGAAVKE